MNGSEFDILGADMKRAIHEDMTQAAAQIVDGLWAVPALERGNWMAAQVRAYLSSVQRFGVDPVVMSFHMGLLIGTGLGDPPDA
jgi:hypothetical protein